ncbi:MAG: thiamine diphosphokinase [Lentisphaeria bacterium]
MTALNQNTVILANGDFPTHTQPRQILKNADFVICCDGAAEKLLAFGRTPDIIIGDMDSLPPTLKQNYSDRIISISEQETNDLTKAFMYAQEKGLKKITILGGTGLREDHTLGNIAHFADFAELCPDIQMVTDFGVFQAIWESSTISAIPGQQISIISFNPEMPITSTGLKYPLKERCLTRWWQATLNEAVGNSFTLTFPQKSPLLLFKNFVAK